MTGWRREGYNQPTPENIAKTKQYVAMSPDERKKVIEAILIEWIPAIEATLGEEWQRYL